MSNLTRRIFGVFALLAPLGGALAQAPTPSTPPPAPQPPTDVLALYPDSVLENTECFKDAVKNTNGHPAPGDKCEDTFRDGQAFAFALRKKNPDLNCYEALDVSGSQGKQFAKGIRFLLSEKYDNKLCEYQADYLANLCGVALRCWDGGKYGLAVYPVAALGLATMRIGGGVPRVFTNLGLASVSVGAGARAWMASALLDAHAYLFYAANRTTEQTQGEDTYRLGAGLGVGAVNGLFTVDLLWLMLGDRTNAQFLGGGLALSVNIDLASGATMAFAALSPKPKHE